MNGGIAQNHIVDRSTSNSPFRSTASSAKHCMFASPTARTDCILLSGRHRSRPFQGAPITDHFKYDVAIRVLAEQAKKNYRELLVYRAFAQLLKNNGFEDVVEETLDDARSSPSLQKDADAYDAVIDSKIPPSDSDRLDEAIQEALATLPPTELPN